VTPISSEVSCFCLHRSISYDSAFKPGSAGSRLNEDNLLSMKCGHQDANLHPFHLHVGSGKYQRDDTIGTGKTANLKLPFLLALLIVIARVAPTIGK
jgi:hypothetical protein